MKKQIKKSLCVLLIGLLTLSLVSCKKKTDEEEDYEYAENDVYSTTEEEIDDTTEEITTTATKSDATEEIPELPDNTFNVKDDANSNNSNINFDNRNISIEGKVFIFPCTYEDITRDYKLYYVLSRTDTTDYLVDPDTNILTVIDRTDPKNTPNMATSSDALKDIDAVTLEATPKNGNGHIEFRFTSDDKTDIKHMKCTEVTLDASYTDNEELFTISLPGNIHFGSTADEIIEEFGTLHKEYDNKKGIFYLVYNINHTEYTFMGRSDGLTYVNIKYN